jgi:hypothetical protein
MCLSPFGIQHELSRCPLHYLVISVTELGLVLRMLTITHKRLHKGILVGEILGSRIFGRLNII